MGDRRKILLVSEQPLLAKAQSFLNRSAIDIDAASGALIEKNLYDLIVVDAEAVQGSLGEELKAYSTMCDQVLVLAKNVPEKPLLDLAEAFLVEPYTQSELIGAIGDLLGTELRRALRLGVVLPAKLKRSDERTLSATVLQLSQTGCLFEIESPIGVGERLSVSFVLPSNNEELTLSGTVVSGNELQLLYGMRFDSSSETERLAILVFVELGVAAGGSSKPGLSRDFAE